MMVFTDEFIEIFKRLKRKDEKLKTMVKRQEKGQEKKSNDDKESKQDSDRD